MLNSIIESNLKHYWHPCSQMKDYEQFPPLIIKRAQGSYLELADGRQIIDAISSWWCKSLGHNHPRLKQALIEQLQHYEHVIGANTCQAPSSLLANLLAKLCAPLNKVFYASEGSCAVEIAMKMSVHAQQILGKTNRTQFLALENSYHGETGLALSASDLGLYRKPYEAILQPMHFLKHIPYVSGPHDPLWQDCSSIWPCIEAQLTPLAEKLSAIILEPICQGAGGMKVYSPDFLKRLRHWTQQNGIYLIADEIMTGLGRTGLPLACQHAKITPDFICLAKNLTGGFLPLSAVVTRDEIYHLFYDDYANGNNFLHSHTFSGNALACSVAVEVLTMFSDEAIYQRIQKSSQQLGTLMQEAADRTQRLSNVRHIGMIAAADLIPTPNQSQERLGYRVFQKALEFGAFLRPLGNTIYWLPPLNSDHTTLVDLRDITVKAINSL